MAEPHALLVVALVSTLAAAPEPAPRSGASAGEGVARASIAERAERVPAADRAEGVSPASAAERAEGLALISLPASRSLSAAELAELPFFRAPRGDSTGGVALALAEDEPGRARLPDPPPKVKEQPAAKPAPRETTRAKPTKAARVEPAPDDPADDEPARSTPKIAPVLALAVAVAAGVTGGVFVSKTMTAIDSLPANTIDPNLIRNQQREVLTNGLIATVSLSAAVAALVSGLALLAVD